MPDKTVQPFAAITSVRSLSKDEEDSGFHAVQDFLTRFGYLAAGSFEDNRLDDTTAGALTRYQEFNGLATTGTFDDQTREQMTTHRCGMPDLIDDVAFATLCAWPNPSLTFAFEDGTNDVAGTTEFQAVRNAFATWAAAAPLTFTETPAAQNPDVAIDWRPANDPDRSMVGGVLAHADFPPGCSVVTNALPKPVHFDDSEHLWVVGAVSGGFDVETVALHEIGHILGLAHSDVAGSVMFPSVSSNTTKRALTADDLSGIRDLYSQSLPTAGTYTIRQKSSGRFVDAHEIADQDFRLVTRTAQNNDTQRWDLAPVGAVYVIRQKSSGRFLDAHETDDNDFRLVTRDAQGDATQRWVVMPVGDGSSTIRQVSNGRFVDAHEIADKDFGLVTRTAQDNDTQRWLLANVGPNTFTLRQKSSGRFVDAHEIAGQDFAVVTRTAQNNDTQRWVLLPSGGGSFTVQQLSGHRFVDAHEAEAQDFSVVTRPKQDNDTQRWLFDRV
jgi:Matrixin/Putative peptidoglycan binding domain/Ricin-type beta-trefoil lectin domain-like